MNDQDNDFNDIKLTNIKSITLNKNPSLDAEVVEKNMSMMALFIDLTNVGEKFISQCWRQHL